MNRKERRKSKPTYNLDEALFGEKIQEIAEKYNFVCKELIQDIVDVAYPKDDIADNFEGSDKRGIKEWRPKACLKYFMDKYKDKYDLIEFADYWNKYVRGMAKENNQICTLEIKVEEK